MTEIFNKAYNQANQILDGSGLSSVIHKQEGGSFNTYDRALEAWKRDATRGIDDMAIDTTAAFKHGGKITSGGLAKITKSIDINGQPHKLAWINSDEASALKAMGGSGKKVGGIPAYWLGGVGDWDAGDTGDASSPGVEDYGYHSDADVGYSEADSASGSAQAAAGEGYMGTGEDVANMSAWSQSEGDATHGTSPEDIAAHQKAYGSPTVGLPAGTYEHAAAPYESFDERARLMKEWLSFGGADTQSYKDSVIAFAKDRYGKNAQMKHMFDREAARVLDQMAVEYDLPLWGIGLRSMDDLGTGEALHYWQYSGYEDEDGNKIPGAIELAHRGYYGGKDSGFLSGLASLLGNIFLPGGPVIQSLAERTIEGYRKANPNDPRYWPKHERSYNDALQAVRNEYSDKKRGIKEGFGASLKELIEMYKRGSDDKANVDDTTKKLGFTLNNKANVDAMDASSEKYPQKPTELPQLPDVKDYGISAADMAAAYKELGIDISNTRPEAKKDREGTYDDFWKDPSEELYQGNYEESPQKLKKLPKLKEDLTEKTEEEKEKRSVTDLVNLEGDLVERLSLQKVAKLLKDIYGEDYTPFGGTA